MLSILARPTETAEEIKQAGQQREGWGGASYVANKSHWSYLHDRQH